jgi:error-prone DNA polymerase
VLHKTLGVPLFQEQAMKIAMEAAEFTPAEANSLRRAMATFRHMGTIGQHEQRFVSRMIERGYEPEFAQRCFDQIKGFGEYGFPESHACSFALLVYISAWMKCHYPEVFAAALLNSQPMGFYAPAQLVRDAREHGVEVRHPDVNASDWDATLEARAVGERCALRLGLRPSTASRRTGPSDHAAVRGGPSPTSTTCACGPGCRRRRWTGWPRRTPWLAEADPAAGAVGGQGRAAGVERAPVRGHGPARGGRPPARGPAGAGPVGGGGRRLPDHPPVAEGPSGQLPARAAGGRRGPDGAGLSAAPPTERAAGRGRRGGAGAPAAGHGQGRLLHDRWRTRPGWPIWCVWPDVFERLRPVAMGARMVLATGQGPAAEGVTHLVVETLEDWTPMLGI